MQMKSTMTYPVLEIGSLEKKYGSRFQWYLTFHVSFKPYRLSVQCNTYTSITTITGLNTMTNKQMANCIFKVYESETDKIQIYFWQMHTYTNGKKRNGVVQKC